MLPMATTGPHSHRDVPTARHCLRRQRPMRPPRPTPARPRTRSLSRVPSAVAGRAPAIKSGIAATSATAKPWLAGALVGALIAALTIVGAALAGLLVHEFGSIDDKFAAVDARFARLEARMDARFTAQDAKINEINLKLTALIATLDKTDDVDAALAGDTAPP